MDIYTKIGVTINYKLYWNRICKRWLISTRISVVSPRERAGCGVISDWTPSC